MERSSCAQPKSTSDGRALTEQRALKWVAFLLDIVRDLKRVNAHLAAAAYPVLEGRGELLSSRLKQDYQVAGFRVARTKKKRPAKGLVHEMSMTARGSVPCLSRLRARLRRFW